MPIDNIVLPTYMSSFCQEPGDHSLDDADNDYHPIYATSIDSKDESASDDDDVGPTNDDMEDNSCVDSHLESLSDVIEVIQELMLLATPPPSPSHPVFPSVEPSSPGKNINGFTFLPSVISQQCGGSLPPRPCQTHM